MTETPDNTLKNTGDSVEIEQTSTVSQSDKQENLKKVKTDKNIAKTIQKNSVNNSNVKMDNLITVSS